MLDCNLNVVPCQIQPLGTDANGKRHFEDWEYASAVGMLMYLAGNAYPEIQYAVHQCACFTHAPRHSHAIAVKEIAHYLKGVLDKEEGLCYKVNDQCNLICIVILIMLVSGLMKMTKILSVSDLGQGML